MLLIFHPSIYIHFPCSRDMHRRQNTDVRASLSLYDQFACSQNFKTEQNDTWGAHCIQWSRYS